MTTRHGQVRPDDGVGVGSGDGEKGLFMNVRFSAHFIRFLCEISPNWVGQILWWRGKIHIYQMLT
ncbi:hypothetical protein D3C72_2476560 [compost metagenome]